MKTNSLSRRITALVLIVMFTLALITSCGKAETVTYNYKDCSAEIQAAGQSLDSSLIQPTYEALYKDSTVELCDDTLTLIIADVKNEIAVTEKDGKYVMAGEYVDRMKTSLSQLYDGYSMDYDIYAAKSGDALQIVYAATASQGGYTATVTIKVNYTK